MTKFEVYNIAGKRERAGLGIRMVKQRLIDGVWTDVTKLKMRDGIEVEVRGMTILSPDSMFAQVDAQTRFVIEEATDTHSYPACCVLEN